MLRATSLVCAALRVPATIESQRYWPGGTLTGSTA